MAAEILSSSCGFLEKLRPSIKRKLLEWRVKVDASEACTAEHSPVDEDDDGSSWLVDDDSSGSELRS